MSNSTPLSQVVDIPSKGKGVIALAPISPGTLIVAESPLVVLNDESFDRKGQLSPRELRILATYPPLDGGGYGEDDTWRFKLSNGIPRGDGTAAIYKTVTRVNHSCAPNSAYHWNAALQKEGKYAHFFWSMRGKLIYLNLFSVTRYHSYFLWRGDLRFVRFVQPQLLV